MALSFSCVDRTDTDCKKFRPSETFFLRTILEFRPTEFSVIRPTVSIFMQSVSHNCHLNIRCYVCTARSTANQLTWEGIILGAKNGMKSLGNDVETHRETSNQGRGSSSDFILILSDRITKKLVVIPLSELPSLPVSAMKCRRNRKLTLHSLQIE